MAEFVVHRVTKIRASERRWNGDGFKTIRLYITSEDTRDEVVFFTHDMDLAIEIEVAKEEPNGANVPGTVESSASPVGETEGREGELRDPEGIVTAVCTGRKLEERTNAS